MSDYNQLSQQFLQHYYQVFETDRSQLGSLYRAGSMLTFERSQVQGADAIVQKLKDLPFQQVQHAVSTQDAQPGSPNGQDVIIVITGKILIDGGDHAQFYTEMFHLVPENGGYFIFNHIFRFVQDP